MKLTSLLEETSNKAIAYFRKRSISEAFEEVEKLRKMFIWEQEACGNIRVAFENLGIPFEINSIAETMVLLDRLQVRLAQLREYYEDEKHFHKMQTNPEYAMKNFIGCPIVGVHQPKWQM